MAFTKEQLAAMLSRPGVAISGQSRRPAPPQPVKDSDGMNKTERAYSLYLEAKKRAGEIAAWEFEAVKIRIGENGRRCYYSPDFMVSLHDGAVEFHEVKGFMRDDARVKLEAARRICPWATFRLVKRNKGQWAIH